MIPAWVSSSPTALAACESQSASSQDVATVRAAGDAMEESGSFTVEMTIRPRDAGAPTSTQSTISGWVDLSGGRSTFEARSSDEDAWTELVVDGVAYQSRDEIANAPDWCAVPLSNLDGNALIQTGPLFGDVPDLLRSATGASVVPDASTADSTAYRLTVPMRETALPAARVEGDEVTVWLDDMSRLVRAEFVISLGDRPRLVGPVRSNEATGDRTPRLPGLTSQAELALPLQGAEMREERHSLPAALGRVLPTVAGGAGGSLRDSTSSSASLKAEKYSFNGYAQPLNIISKPSRSNLASKSRFPR